MLVSVDVDRGMVTVYGATVITVPINQFNKLRSLLSGKQVNYISEVTPASGDEVLELIADLAGSGYTPSQPAADADGRQWLHATGSGQLYLPLAGKLKLNFQGPMDFVPLDRVGYDVAEKFPVVKSLLDRKKLEIVSTSQMNRIKKRAFQEQQAKDEVMYGSMIIDTSVKNLPKHGGKVTMVSEPKGEVIDMDDYDKTRVSDYDMLPDEMKEVLKQGWGAKEEEGEGEPEEGNE